MTDQTAETRADPLEELRAALLSISRMHSAEPDGGMGWIENREYGHMESVCQVCGTADEYGVPWPCPTRQQADAALTPGAPDHE